jgi:hypothetical protein
MTSNHREVVDAVILPFKDQPIRDAISDCIGRDPTWIESYFNTYFVLNDSSKDDSLETREEEPPKQEIKDTDKSNLSEGLEQSPGSGPESTELNPDVDKGPNEEPPADDDNRIPKARKRVLRPEEKFALYIQKELFSWRPEKKAFINNNGSRIIFEEALFPWVQYDISGNVVQRFRIEEGSLEKGLTIPAAAWEFMKRNPDNCILIVHDKSEYLRYKWADLNQLIFEDRLKVYPAAYLIKEVTEDKD